MRYSKYQWNSSNGLDTIDAIYSGDRENFGKPFLDSLGNEVLKKIDYKTQKESFINKLPKEYELPLNWDSLTSSMLKIRK